MRKTMTEAHKIERLLQLSEEHLEIMLKAKQEGKNVDKEIERDCAEIQKWTLKLGGVR